MSLRGMRISFSPWAKKRALSNWHNKVNTSMMHLREVQCQGKPEIITHTYYEPPKTVKVPGKITRQAAIKILIEQKKRDLAALDFEKMSKVHDYWVEIQKICKGSKLPVPPFDLIKEGVLYLLVKEYFRRIKMFDQEKDRHLMAEIFLDLQKTYLGIVQYCWENIELGTMRDTSFAFYDLFEFKNEFTQGVKQIEFYMGVKR